MAKAPKNLKPRKDTADTFKKMREGEPEALTVFRKKDPRIYLEGRGQNLKANVDLDAFVIDATARQRIRDILKGNTNGDTADHYIRQKIISQIRRAIVRSLKEGNIKLKR